MIEAGYLAVDSLINNVLRLELVNLLFSQNLNISHIHVSFINGKHNQATMTGVTQIRTS